jgi:hypothetical protein
MYDVGDNSLECADLSALWPAATGKQLKEKGVEPPWAKAVTGHRTPRSGL